MQRECYIFVGLYAIVFHRRAMRFTQSQYLLSNSPSSPSYAGRKVLRHFNSIVNAPHYIHASLLYETERAMVSTLSIRSRRDLGDFWI